MRKQCYNHQYNKNNDETKELINSFFQKKALRHLKNLLNGHKVSHV